MTKLQKKILLINTLPESYKGETKSMNLSPGVLSIGTWITKNSDFKVKIIDVIVEENYFDLIKKEISDEETFLVGLSVMSSCIPNAMEITRLIKKMRPSVKIIWGGVHCILYPEQTASYSLIDFVAYGEGEKSMLNLAICLSKKKPLSSVNGIIYKEKGKLIRNPPESPIDMNEFGLLDYGLLNQKIFSSGIGIIYTSRGCPHRCTFCINVVAKNRNWRAMNAENVLKEIDYLVKKHNIKVLFFGDDCFFVNKERSRKILDGIINSKYKLKISTSTRVDYFNNGLIDEDLLLKMKNSGFFNLNLGAEFGSQKMLDFIKKDIKIEETIKAVELLNKFGIGSTLGFMTGFPTETRKDTSETLKVIKRLCRINPGLNVLREGERIYEWRDKIRISGPDVYRPYPGGELFDFIVKEYGWETPSDLDEWEEYFNKNIRYGIEEYPWIKNPSFYAAIQFYVKSGRSGLFLFLEKMKMPYPLKFKIANFLFYPFARLRFLLEFFDFPMEYIVGKKMGVIRGLEG